jgi:hypothetical protein
MANPSNYSENAVTGRSSQFVEFRDDPNHKVLQFAEGLDYGLRFRPTKLVERYLRNNISVALELALEIDGGNSRYSALVLNVLNHGLHRDLNRAGTGNDYQFSMLVDNVVVVDDEHQRVNGVASVIWLKLFDETTDYRLSDSLYFSFVSGKKVFLRWPRLKDGKLDPSHVGLPVTRLGEVPHNVVENRSQVMNHLSCQDSEAKGNRAISVVLNCLANKLLVLVAKDGISALLKKPVDLDLKILDVLLGPI